MRIISQDGKVDVPYEISSMEISSHSDNSKWVIYANTHNRTMAMATYTTEEMCERVMERLHNEFEYYMAEATPDGNGFCFIPPKVFRFPVDDKV